jgi:hypothetical protein
MRIAAACLVLGMCFSTAIAQMGGPGSAAAPGTITTPAKAFDSQLSLIEGEMMGVVKTMPTDKFNFAPSAAIFVPGQKPEFTGVRTFAQQVKHVAQANFFFYATVSGLKPEADVAGIDKLTQKDEIVSVLAASFAFAHKAIATLTPANAFEVVKSGEPGLQTRGTLAGFGVAHANDHYGQMVEYLRMNGLVPPGSAPAK